MDVIDDTKWTQTVYLISPYKVDNEFLTEECILQARNWAAKLWSWGYVVICPLLNAYHLIGAYKMPDYALIKGNLELLSRCDMIVVSPDWSVKYNEWAQTEIEYATKTNKQIYYLNNIYDEHHLRNAYNDRD